MTESTTTDSGYPKGHCVRACLDRIDRTRKMFDQMVETAERAELARERFPDLISAVGFHVFCFGGSVEIFLIVDRMIEVLPLARYLALYGYRRRCAPEDTPKESKRTYHLRNESGIPLNIVVTLKTSAVCRWVKTGERTIDVTELQCEGGVPELEMVEV